MIASLESDTFDDAKGVKDNMPDMIMVPAVYEQGVLRPLAPLVLPEHQRVRVVIESVEDTSSEEDEVDAELRALVGT